MRCRSSKRIDSLLVYSIPYYQGKYSVRDSRLNFHWSDKRFVLDKCRWRYAEERIVVHPRRYRTDNHTWMAWRFENSCSRCCLKDTLDSPSYYIGNWIDREPHRFSSSEERTVESHERISTVLLSADMRTLWHYPSNWAGHIRKDSSRNNWDRGSCHMVYWHCKVPIQEHLGKWISQWKWVSASMLYLTADTQWSVPIRFCSTTAGCAYDR